MEFFKFPIFKRLWKASFATASATKNKKGPLKGGGSVKPEKQKLMKRQKLAAVKDHKKGHVGGDRATPFLKALFTRGNEAQTSSAFEIEELQRRELIAKSWSRWCMVRVHETSTQEAEFVKSRIKAIKALQNISPILAEKASEISYEAPPSNVKMATETAPEVLPFG